MDSRDEERRVERSADSQSKEYRIHEQCERCGRALSIVYYYKGRKLCESCIDEAKREWKDVGGERPPMSMYRISQEKGKKSNMLAFLESLFAEILIRLGIKKKKEDSEIVALRMKKKTFVPFAKPMKEESISGAKKEEKTKEKKKESAEEKEEKKEKFGQHKKE
jgi:ribosomal protein L37E